MWPNPQVTADLVKFTEEILNGKLLFLYSTVIWKQILWFSDSSDLARRKIFKDMTIMEKHVSTFTVMVQLFGCYL